MKEMIEKLEGMAEIVASEKSALHFFGLLKRDDIPDSWDLVVSADKLEPWARDSLWYLAALMKKTLTPVEIGKIAQIAALPLDHKVIAGFINDGKSPVGRFTTLHRAASCEEAFILWTDKNNARPTQTA